MVKQLLFIYTFLLLSFAHAQQVNYDLGDILYNPGESSLKEDFVSFSVFDLQSQVASGSRSFHLYGQYEFEDFSSTIGLGISKSQFSTFQSNNLNLSYSYKVSLDTNSFMSFGLRAGVVMANLSNSLIFEDQLSLLDASINETKESLVEGKQNAFMTDAGIVLKKNKLKIGLSVLNLIKPSWKFSNGSVGEPTSVNATVKYEFVVNSNRTLRLLPVLLGSYSSISIKSGLNTKILFSGYEGFEGKVYGGGEYVFATGQAISNMWQFFVGYSQDKFSFQYGYGNVLSFSKELGSSNFLMLSYKF